MPDHAPHTGRGRRPVIYVPKNVKQIAPSRPAEVGPDGKPLKQRGKAPFWQQPRGGK